MKKIEIGKQTLRHDGQLTKINDYLKAIEASREGYLVVHVRETECPADEQEVLDPNQLDGLAVIPYRLYYAICCLLEELKGESVPLEAHADAGLNHEQHKEFWEIVVGDSARESCSSLFRHFNAPIRPAYRN